MDTPLDVVIVSYNCREALIRCIESLASFRSRSVLRTVVVDNASVDGTVEAIRERFPDVTVIANDQNLGFAAGCNQGILNASGDMVLLLNPDCRLTESAVDALLWSLSNRPDAACIAPRLVKNGHTSSPVYAGVVSLREFAGKMLLLGKLARLVRAVIKRLSNDKSTPQLGDEAVREVDYVEGACVLCRRIALVSVGLLDPGYFLFFEDQDLCVRLRERGYQVFAHDGVAVEHEQGVSANQDVKRTILESYRSLCYFFRRHRSTSSIRALKCLIGLGALIRVVLFSFARVLGRPNSAKRAAAYVSVVKELVLVSGEG